MEPQENKLLAVRKAISAHEQAQAAVGDLMRDNADPRYDALVARLEQNLGELRLLAETSEPEERV